MAGELTEEADALLDELRDAAEIYFRKEARRLNRRVALLFDMDTTIDSFAVPIQVEQVRLIVQDIDDLLG